MLQVIGSGFGRTGTLSMKMALEQLGYSPCYHMVEVMSDNRRAEQWYGIACGEQTDWRSVMDGFAATVDFPACVFYRELMEAFPEAKVIHNVRDPQRWYDSAHETIYQFHRAAPRWLQRLIKPLRYRMQMAEILLWQGLFEGEFENRQHAIKVFQRHTDAVKETVPPERLLVFDVKEGWEPLCAFLQVPVPDTPFPHVNDTQQFKRMNRRLYRLFHWGPVALVALLIALLAAIAW